MQQRMTGIKGVVPEVYKRTKPPYPYQTRRLLLKTATTYSPTVTQYHRRDRA